MEQQRGTTVFSGLCPQEVREQVVKHLQIYLRNVPPQLEIEGYLHTRGGALLPCTLLQINPLFGRSLEASCHVKTCWVHKYMYFLIFSLLSLPSEFLVI